MGDEGTLLISEAAARTALYRESWVDAEKWTSWVKKGFIKDTVAAAVPKKPAGGMIDVRESPVPPKYEIPVTMDKAFHYPHLENFFDAIRGKAKLNCPAEAGYETAVTVLKVNQAVAAGSKLEFKPEDFKV